MTASDPNKPRKYDKIEDVPDSLKPAPPPFPGTQSDATGNVTVRDVSQETMVRAEDALQRPDASGGFQSERTDMILSAIQSSLSRIEDLLRQALG